VKSLWMRWERSEISLVEIERRDTSTDEVCDNIE
jgi:hypothetical protein